MVCKLASRNAREDYLRLNCADVHEQCDPGDWLRLNRADVHKRSCMRPPIYYRTVTNPPPKKIATKIITHVGKMP